MARIQIMLSLTTCHQMKLGGVKMRQYDIEWIVLAALMLSIHTFVDLSGRRDDKAVVVVAGVAIASLENNDD